MTSYLEAKMVPLFNSLEGVLRVSVAEVEISSGEGRGVAHLGQKRLSSGFSE